MPSSPSTIAKPYAEAIFRHGTEQGGDALDTWLADLTLLAAIVSTNKVAAMLASPSMSKAEKAAALAEIAGGSLAAPTLNLLELLATNKRLPLLPAIAAGFSALKADAERRLDVEVTTAIQLADAEAKELTASLAKHFGREITLHTNADPDLLAGALIRAGDVMIDASYRGRLDQLRKHLESSG